jgi:hypothetical protein
MVEASGEENRNVIEFTHCKSFEVSSGLNFNPAAPTSAPARAAAKEQGFPPDQKIAITLTTPITESMAVGSLIEGKVSGSKTVPDGAIARGRIRRLERFSPDAFIVALESSRIEAETKVWRFFADLTDISNAQGLDWSSQVSNITRSKVGFLSGDDAPAQGWQNTKTVKAGTLSRTDRTTLPALPGVGSFFVRSEHLNIAKGVQLIWITKILAP